MISMFHAQHIIERAHSVLAQVIFPDVPGFTVITRTCNPSVKTPLNILKITGTEFQFWEQYPLAKNFVTFALTCSLRLDELELRWLHITGTFFSFRSWAMMVKVNYLLWMGSLFIRFGLKVTNRSNFLLMKKKNWLLCSFRPLRSPIKRPEFRGRKSSADELAGMTKLECKSISHSKTFIKLFDISFKIGWIHNQNITSQIQAFKLFKMPLFCAHFAKLSRNFQNYLTISIILSSLI